MGLPDGSTIAYENDALGRRVAKYVDGVVTEKYLWQGRTQLLAIYDGSGSLKSRFLYADARMPVAMEADGQTYYLACDQVGSLRAVADASGTVVKTVTYDSFGNVLEDSAPTLEVPFGFAGGLYDAYTGLVRFGYRDYDAEVGRWTAKDLIGFNGEDSDLYGYVQNNPIIVIDPNGLLGIPFSAIKKALKKVHKELGGSLPKGKPGKWGSPQHGTPQKGYRLDPAHPGAPSCSPESQPHINWWDYTKGKKGKGARYGAVPIINGILGFIGSMLDPFDAISGELAGPEDDMIPLPQDLDSPCPCID